MWLTKRNQNDSYFPTTLSHWLGDYSNLWRNWSDFEEDSVVWRPRVDIEDKGDRFQVKADLPGIKKEDLKITLNHDQLTIRGERKYEKDAKKDNHRVVERAHGVFSRTFQMPDAVKSDEIKADYKDGVLTIEIPKTEVAKPKLIDIK